MKDHFVKAKVGGMSLVGVGSKRPCSWGNYFWLSGGPRILNMWAENLEDAVEKFLLDGLVKIRDYGDVAIIIDERIPQDYFYNKCCFTSSGGVSLEIAQDIYKTLGDPTNELLRFTDPKQYHDLRGENYTILPSGIAMVSRTVKIEFVDAYGDAGFIYAPYVPQFKQK